MQSRTSCGSKNKKSIAMSEWRQDMRVLGKEKVRVDGKRLAQFLAENEAREGVLLQRMRDLEAQGIGEGHVSSATTPTRNILKTAVAIPTRTPFTLDLTDLPTFEEDE
jgi:hypothetical protein